MARAVTGGLLSGLGRGIIAEGARRREDALIAQEREDRQAEIDRQQAEQMRREAVARAREIRQDLMRQAESERSREESRGLLRSTVTGEDGTVYGVTQGADVKDLGFKAAPKGSSSDDDGTGLSVKDKRLWDTVKDRFTTKGLQGETTDWKAVAAEFKRQNRPDLAQLAAPPGAGATIDVNSDQYMKAEQMAEDWVNGQAGFWRSDKTDFAQYGGNREEAKQAKTMEFYRQLTGQGASKGAQANPEPASTQASPKGFDALTAHHEAQMKRGPVQNDDGTISTVRTIIVNLDGKETIIPTVWDGKIVSNDEAIRRAKASGKKWPQFSSVAEAEAADEQWHRSLGLSGPGKAPAAGGAGERAAYGSAEDVRAAFRSGALTREQAVKILRAQFGMQ